MPGTWPDARRAIRDRLNGLKVPATYSFAYSTEASGPFVEGETLTFGSSGGTATLITLDDDGTTGTMDVRMALDAAAPAITNTITGGTSSATAVVASDPGGTKQRSLTAFERIPMGRQGPSIFPYSWIRPVNVVVTRYPGAWREYLISPVVRIALLPAGKADDMPEVQRLYDEFWEALAERWDAFAALGGDADISVEQEFSELDAYQDADTYWGFDMTLGNVRVSSAATFSA